MHCLSNLCAYFIKKTDFILASWLFLCYIAPELGIIVMFDSKQ